MRALGAGIGLLGLLITVAIMAHLWSTYNSAVAPAARQAHDKASQFSGYDADSGMPAKDSIKLEPVSVSNRLKHVLVKSIVAGGAFEKYYGLKEDDAILGTGSMDFRDQDGEMAVELVHRAYQTRDTLIVLRDGKKITLPLPAGAAAAAASGAAPARKSDDALQRQLDAIPGVR
jgi:hypothetical protein